MIFDPLPTSRALREDELSWLHDAQVPTMTFDSRGNASLRFVIEVNFEAGSPSWDGKRILVIASDVQCLAMRTHPTARVETINSFRMRETGTFRLERSIGGGTGNLAEYGIAFQSGGELSFMCRQLLVAATDE